MDDSRGRKLAVVAHCLLNQNAKVSGLAGWPGVFGPVVSLLERHGIGIIQMRCPEIVHLGPGRPLGTDTREQYDSASYRRVCRSIAREVVGEVARYVESGYAVLCILGVEGSPSCSVSRVPVLVGDDQRALRPGRGVYMEVLHAELRSARLDVPMVGIPESEVAGDLDEALGVVTRMISG